MSCKKYEKTVFFHVFRDTLYKVHKNCEKKTFFELSARCSSKSVRKQCFFTFFETICTKFTDNAKNSFFITFCMMFIKKCENIVFFHVFRDTLYKVHKKCDKHRFFLVFLDDVHQKVLFHTFCAFCTENSAKHDVQKTVIFHIF